MISKWILMFWSFYQTSWNGSGLEIFSTPIIILFFMYKYPNSYYFFHFECIWGHSILIEIHLPITAQQDTCVWNISNYFVTYWLGHCLWKMNFWEKGCKFKPSQKLLLYSYFAVSSLQHETHVHMIYILCIATHTYIFITL